MWIQIDKNQATQENDIEEGHRLEWWELRQYNQRLHQNIQQLGKKYQNGSE